MTQDSCSQQNGPRINGVAKAVSDSPTTTTAAAPLEPRSLLEVCQALRQKVLAFLEEQTEDEDGDLRHTQNRARESMGVIEEALRRYEPAELSLSYNGGKDCLVLLILILACWAAPTSQTPSASGPRSEAGAGADIDTQLEASIPTKPGASPSPRPLQAIYIAPPDPFPEVEDFVAKSTAQYHLDLARYALPMRPALEAYLGDRKCVKAVFMGTRRTDPHSEFLTHFDPTDKDWPQFMRINPVINWHYVEIWTFIRRIGIPFCSLYQKGFSSLGGMNNTRPNPALALGSDGTTFRPAYELVRDDEERLGRDR